MLARPIPSALAALHRYLPAFDCRLELHAIFPDQSVQLKLPNFKRVA
jgi:hypothetical protein